VEVFEWDPVGVLARGAQRLGVRWSHCLMHARFPQSQRRLFVLRIRSGEPDPGTSDRVRENADLAQTSSTCLVVETGPGLTDASTDPSFRLLRRRIHDASAWSRRHLRRGSAVLDEPSQCGTSGHALAIHAVPVDARMSGRETSKAEAIRRQVSRLLAMENPL
jgi:hypothetical protein